MDFNRVFGKTYYKCPKCKKNYYYSAHREYGGDNLERTFFSDCVLFFQKACKLSLITKCIKCHGVFRVEELERSQIINDDFKESTYSRYKDDYILKIDPKTGKEKRIYSEKQLAKISKYEERKPIYMPKMEVDDYFSFLEKGMTKNNEEEEIIRMLILWRYNRNIINIKSNKLIEKTKKKQSYKLTKPILCVNMEEFIWFDNLDELRWRDNLIKLIALLDKFDNRKKIMIAELYRNLGEFDKCINTLNEMNDESLYWFKSAIIHECNLKRKCVFSINTPEIKKYIPSHKLY